MDATSGPRVFTPPGRAQVLADLRWLLLSPPLLSPETFPGLIQGFSEPELLAVEKWLQQLEGLDGTSADLPVIDQPLRLGRYAERLMRFFLGPVKTARDTPPVQSHGFELLAHSIARRGNAGEASTLGEIDFLLQAPSGTCWHWELAVKVYLCAEQARRIPGAASGAGDLHGPNRAETFEAKLEKLFARQLQQPIPPLPLDATAPAGHGRNWQRAAFAKGRIFYRLGEEAPVIFKAPHQPLLNPGHLRGFWCAGEDFAALMQAWPGCQAWPLERLEWLSPKTAATRNPRCEPIDERAAAMLDKPLMVALMRENLELTRGFLLPVASCLSEP